MKGIIKLFPAALAMLALASCSNDDFLGSENASGKLQLEATVEAPNSDDGATRAAFLFTSSAQNSLWENGDVFRVYDASLQKYDEFKCDGSAITVDGTPVVAEHSKAIFPGNKVYYAGYDKKNDDVIAIMNVPTEITYGGPVTNSNGTVFYGSYMPMWGDVLDPTASNLKVELKTLSAFTDITVYQKSVKYIRVFAASAGGTTDATPIATGSSTTLATATNDEILASSLLDAKTPLAGYFEAQLKDGGVLKANRDNPVVSGSYKSLISVDLSQNAADEAHIYIPIIAGVKYTNLIIQTSANGTNWATLKAYKGVTFERNGALRKDLVRGLAPITAVVSSLEDLNTKLGTIASTPEYQGRTVNITATGDIKTSQAQAVLTIPGMSADQIVNFNFPIDDTDNPLTIAGGTSGYTMTINLNQGISGNTAVTINTNGKLVLTGSINSSRGDQYKKLNVINAQELTLGSSEDFKSFTSNMDIVSASPLVIDAAEGTIENVTLNTGATLKVETGKVTKVFSASTGAMNIAGGEVTTIEQAADGNVVIGAAKVGTLEAKPASGTLSFTTTVNKGAEITDLKLAKSTGAVSITDAAVTTLETAANNIDVISTDTDATVGTLKLGAITPIVTLNESGATHTKGLAKIENLQTTDANNQQIVSLNSYDKAAVGNVTFARTSDAGPDNISAYSYINSTTSKAADIKTNYIGTAGEIYTAAQLAGVTTGKNYKLMADIYANSKEWTPVNLKGTFDGNDKTINDVNVKVSGGLFGTISGGEVKNLTINTIAVAKAKTGDMGALAGAATGTVAVTKVNISGFQIGKTSTGDNNNKNINYGGLFGTTNGTITLTDNMVNGNFYGYANMGGFIGNVKGGSVSILTSDATGGNTYQSRVTFSLPTAPTSDYAGTIGNFIGTISGNGVSVSIGGTEDGKGGTAATFFDYSTGWGVNSSNAAASGDLKYDVRKNSDNKKFVGMKNPVATQALNYEIGYCSATTLGTIYLYNTIKDNLGNEYKIKLENINVFE